MITHIAHKYIELGRNFGFLFSAKLFLLRLFKKDNHVNALIEKCLIPFANKEFPVSTCGTPARHHVWSMWWQGEQQMPELVKMCYGSHKHNLMTLPVDYTLITKENYYQYIELPQYIMNKVEKGIISLTHLSDIIRVLLLEKYGGLWIDMTLLIVKPFQPQWLECEFFSVNLRGYFTPPHWFWSTVNRTPLGRVPAISLRAT